MYIQVSVYVYTSECILWHRCAKPHTQICMCMYYGHTHEADDVFSHYTCMICVYVCNTALVQADVLIQSLYPQICVYYTPA